MLGLQPGTGVFILQGSVSGAVEFYPSTSLPDFGPGDAEFLDADPRRPVQLRPVLKSECPYRKVTARDRLLVCRTGEDAVDLYAIVQLPPFRRENLPRNIRLAIAHVERLSPAFGAAFRAAFDAATA